MSPALPADAPRVAVFVRSFLPISQTFVYDALTRLTRYRPTVFCLLREHEASFPFTDLHIGQWGYRTTMYAPNFVRTFKQHAFSLVHAQFGTTAVYATPYARRADLPLVVSFHGYEVPLLKRAHRLFGPNHHYAWFSARMLRTMTLGLCASVELRDMLIEHGVPAEKLRIHRLGVDTQRFVPTERSSDGPLRVLMVGRFVEKKGFADGIAAFARVANAQLTLVGSGPLDASLREQVHTLGIDRRVTFTGAITHQEVLASMQSHDVVIAPSKVAQNGDRDSGLIALREAASCGLVAIATRHGGLPDSVDDEVSGYLVDEGDVDGIAERLSRLANDPALRARMGAAARAKMLREFDHSTAMAVLEQAYDDARAMHARTSPGRPDRAARASR